MKLALFTDIHFGAKNNSYQHNADCLDYISWFKANVIAKKCNAIVFMGDWFENRNAINVSTLNYSNDALESLDELGLPIYFIIGNHDLYHRGNREQYSTYQFKKFKNVVLINEMTQVDNMLFFPYLFSKEYPDAASAIEKIKPEYVFGHFEFRNFIVTGSDRMIDHGPDHKMFSIPKYLFSGHYHKRQAHDNVIYIGNTFPTNYGDAWDDARGMALLDTDKEEVDFIDWNECPTYRKVKLSDVLNGQVEYPNKCRVRCLIDIDIGYSEAQSLREEMISSLGLREFSLEENVAERKEAIAGEEMEDFDIGLLNDAVIKMLHAGVTGTTTINPSKLIEIYERL